MSILVQPTRAVAPRSLYIRVASLALVAFFVILAVSQLFKYEAFPDVIATTLPGISTGSSHLLAALLVTGEVFALPFLLGMFLSPAMRVLSMVVGWLVIGAWLSIAVYGCLYSGPTLSAGVFGATVPLSAGWWLVGLFAIVGVLTGWVSYTRWPFVRRTAVTDR